MKKIPTFLEDIMKKMYVEYTKCSKIMNPKTRDSIVLMRNSLVVMFKINPSITYTTVRRFRFPNSWVSFHIHLLKISGKL